MKKIILLTLTLLSFSLAVSADTVVLWTFNSPVNDLDLTTGTLNPATGTGLASPVGTVTHTFTAANGSSDTTSTGDNSNWRITTFPAQGTGNKTCGAQFSVNTVGYENITLIWDVQNSASANRYWRTQYSIDNGTNWVEHNVIVNTNSAVWVNATFTSSFVGVAGANNKTNFLVRMLSEFQSTSGNGAADSYISVSAGTAAAYSGGGTFRLDMVTFSGDVLNINNAQPFISSISNQTIRVDTTLGPIPFTVYDDHTSATSLVLSNNSSNPTLITTNNIVFGGSGTNRTVTLTPEPGQIGTANITIRVTDPTDDKFSESTFLLTVLPTNTAPTITAFSNQVISVNASTTNIAFTIGDLESNPSNLVVNAYAPNGILLPASGVSFGGNGANRTVQLTPAANTAGATWVNVVVTDGTLSATNGFMLKVTRTITIAYWDFNSNPPDTNTATGTTDPVFSSNGVATATSCGTTTNSLGGAAASFDPAQSGTDNTKWRFGQFSAQGTGNKTSGAEFHVDTTGFQNITVTWDHYNSATGNRFWRLQYSIDGTNFLDSNIVYTNPVETTFFPTGGDLSAFAGVNNNTNFAIRIVAEFANTATGGAITNDYQGTQASGGYSVNGTLWLDTVTFFAETFRPLLSVAKDGNNVAVSWPAGTTGFNLQSTTSLNPANWQTVGQPPTVVGNKNVVTITNATGVQFYRLSN